MTNMEKKCLNELIEAMVNTCSDFTDTFRILGSVKSNGSNQEDIIK